MIRVRRRHFRAMCTRPTSRARRPLTRLISIDEGMSMFDVGISIGEIRREEATNFDKGFNKGFHAGYDAGYDEALRVLGELEGNDE